MNRSNVENYFIKFDKFITQDKYINEKEYDKFLDKHKDIFLFLSTQKIRKGSIEKKAIKTKENKAIFMRNHNKTFLDNKCLEYKDFFDNMFDKIDKKIHLDENQRKIVLAEEENFLVIAGAGSGKTTTITARVKYLIDKRKINPKKIAVVSFTNKATEELRERLNKLGCNSVDVYTFHKLGKKILTASGRQIDTIAEEGYQYKIISDYIKKVLFLDKEKFSKFYNSFKAKLLFDDLWKSFENYREYHNFLYKRKYVNNKKSLKAYNDTQIEKRRNNNKSINGEYLRSKEEIDIANFLFCHGIDYQYEKKYIDEIDFNKRYHPDFYIHQLENEHYIEHYGVSEDHIKSKYTKEEHQKYLDNMKLKQSFHNQDNNKGMFIETYSQFNDKIPFLQHLTEELQEKGYFFKSRSQDEIYERLKNTSEDQYFAMFIDKLVIPFISNFKSRGYIKSDFEKLKTNSTVLISNQLEVLEEIYEYYETTLRETNAIDFEDMISEAYNILPTIKEKDLDVDYEYIIIDEYQDISMQRFNLTKQMADLFKAKVMAVGDDWQAIFGFSGADISLFTEFKNYLKKARHGIIKNTYRNSQELVDIARKFIIKNTEQFDKELKTIKSLDFPVELCIYNDTQKLYTDDSKALVLEEVLTQIVKENDKHKVLLLGRFNSDIKSILKSYNFTNKYPNRIVYTKYPNLFIEFLTIHKAKGLGYDQCILINATDEKYGFPAKIIDEPVIKILSNSKESTQYAEERRLFYVALTRTKNKIFILTPKTKASSFVKEIENFEHVKIIKQKQQ